MRGYKLISNYDGLSYDYIIANNCKEAKKLMIENQREWIYEGDNPILEYYAKWDKDANIEGFKLYEHPNDIELLKRGIYSSLQHSTCPICKEEDTTIYQLDNNITCCPDCEDKVQEKGSFKEDK